MILALVLGFGAGFYVGDRASEKEIKALGQRINLYEDRLKVGSPDEARKKFSELEREIKALQPRPVRRLSSEQQQKLRNAWVPLAAEKYVLTIYVEFGSETMRYGDQMRKVYSSAGGTSLFVPATVQDDEHVGVMIGVPDSTNPSEYGRILMTGLRAADIPAKYIKAPQHISLSSTDAYLFICAP